MHSFSGKVVKILAISLLVVSLILSCKPIESEMGQNDFIDQLIALGSRHNLLNPMDVGKVLGVKLEQDNLLPSSEPSSTLYFPQAGSSLSKARVRYILTLDPRMPPVWQGATLHFAQLANYACVNGYTLTNRLDGRFSRGVGSSPMQFSWVVSDYLDRRTVITTSSSESSAQCISTISLTTYIKERK